MASWPQWPETHQSNQFNWHNIMDNWKSAQRFKIYNTFTSSSSWTDGYSLVWNGLICFCVIYGGEVADGCVLCRQHTGIWDLGYTLVHDVSTSLENVHWHPPSQHQLQRALRLGQWYPMKILLHSCKYSAGENRTICWRCNCNCQLKGRHPQLQYSFFSALKNSPPKINQTYTKYKPIWVVSHLWQPPSSISASEA